MQKISLDPTPILSSGIFAGIVAATIIITLSGCRFGNFVEKEPVLDRKPKYSTRPTEFALTASVNGDTRRIALRTSLIPEELSEFMTDPVILYLANPSSGESVLCRNDETKCGTTIYIGSDGKTLGYSGTASPITLWKGFSQCSDQLTVIESGQIVDPRLEVDFKINRTFEGPQCEAALADMVKCYADISLCDSVSSSAKVYQEKARAILGAYIENGLFTEAEVSEITNIGYEVSYR